MKSHHVFLFTIAFSGLVGCGTSNLYKGDTLPDSSVAKVWNTTLLGQPAGFIRIEKIGEHALTTTGGREYALLPGEYDLHIYYMEGGCIGAKMCSVNGTKFFELKLNLKAGHTYAPTYLNHSACILGEPHESPGYVVNVTKEYRTPSPMAQIVACAEK